MALQLLSLVQRFRKPSGETGEATFDEAKELAYLLENDVCVGCLVKAPVGALYCTSFPCQDIAGTVRYIRKAMADGSERLMLPDVQAGIGIRHLMALQGGYARRERQLSAKRKKEVFERDGYQCQLCKKPATQIDHISSHSSRLSNLRALCGECNRRLPFEAVAESQVISPSDEEINAQQMIWIDTATRIASDHPIKIIDVPKWRSYAAQISYARRVRAAQKAAERKLEREQKKAAKAASKSKLESGPKA